MENIVQLHQPDGILETTMKICEEMAPEREFQQTRQLTSQLHAHLRRDIRSSLSSSSSISRFGSLALGPRDALKTIHEFRTRPFMRGMLAAVEEVRQRFPGEKIRILYAGTGPAAPLVLPVFAKYTPDQVQVDAIDFHASSIRILAALSQDMGTRDYFSSFTTGDAITHWVPPERAPHIIVSETMDAGLLNEPQSYITRNLAPQMRPGGIFVPENIEVTLAQTQYESDKTGDPLGSIYTLTPQQFLQPHDDDVRMVVQGSFDLIQPSDSIVRLILKTRVRCFGEETVESDTSIITRPIALAVAIPTPMPGFSEGRAQEMIEASRVNIGYTLGHEVVEIVLMSSDDRLVTQCRFNLG